MEMSGNERAHNCERCAQRDAREAALLMALQRAAEVVDDYVRRCEADGRRVPTLEMVRLELREVAWDYSARAVALLRVVKAARGHVSCHGSGDLEAALDALDGKEGI